MIYSIRDYQIRCNSLALPGSSVLVVDGMNGPNTQKQIALAMKHFGTSRQSAIMDSSGINRVHWHWTVTSYEVDWDARRHYNGVFDYKGNEYDGGAPAQQQAAYIPGKVGVSHTLSANTGAIGLAVVCLSGVKENWSTMTVDQGKFPITWAGVDAMLKKTAEYCKEFDIKPSRWTTLNHGEVQETLGIRQNGKWDIRILPDEPTKILGAVEAGDIMRKRMMEKFW